MSRLLFLLALFLPLPLLPPPPALPPPGDESPPEIRSGTLQQSFYSQTSISAWGLVPQGLQGDGLTLWPGANWGLYVSPVQEADFPFNALALRWKARTPPGTQLILEVRARPEDGTWSEWFLVRPLENQPASSGENYSQLLVIQGHHLQYSATFVSSDPQLQPSLGEVSLIYIDSSQGPVVTQAREGGSLVTASVSRPAVISRAGWGSPEPYASPGWPPEYQEWRKVIIHDTQTKNDDPNPAATVRAIWYYHAKTLGWGDIGYNFLLDRYGNIYEGRFGGENVAGGHALPCYNYGSIGVSLLGSYQYEPLSAAMEYSLVSLLAWESYQHGIDPLGSGYFGERWLPNIFAHRDVRGSCGNTHTDPGDYAYNRLPDIRQRVWESLPEYGQNWVSHNTPWRMVAGEEVSVAVTVQNKGRTTWKTGGSNPFRLGYRWYGLDGARIQQDRWEEHHSDLPFDVGSYQTATVEALLTAPHTPGTYILSWDIVREGVTWLGDQGQPTLDLRVEVEEPTYIAAYAGQSLSPRLFIGQKAQAWVRLRNVGTATWQRSGPNPVKLGTWNPLDRASGFATPGIWESPWRATSLDQAQVAPGEVGTFTFTLTGYAKPGTYREYFNAVAEGKTWFNDLGIYFDITVLPTHNTFLPRVSRGFLGGW